MVDYNVMLKAKKLGVKIYDADGNGTIDGNDLAIVTGQKVIGISAKLGSPEAVNQFKLIEAKASQKGMYRGLSLEWGSGGRSLLLQDRLLCQGMSLADAKQAVKINYFNKLQYHT